MKDVFKYAILLTIQACAFHYAASQTVELIYRERDVSQTQGAQLNMHGVSSQIYFPISRVGIYTISMPNLSLAEVPGTQGADGYEYQYPCDCKNGDILLYQRGYMGHRLIKLDDAGGARVVTKPGEELFSVAIHGSGALSIVVVDPDSNYYYYTTLDCGETWFENSGLPMISLKGAVLMQESDPLRFSVARYGLGNRSYPISVTSNNNGLGPRNIALVGMDSIVWIAPSERANVPDTIWYADIKDSAMKRFETVFAVNGVSDSILMKDIALLSTSEGIAFAFHKSGWYARLHRGIWTVVDFIPPMATGLVLHNSSTISISDNVIRYISTRQTGSKLVTVILDSVKHPFTSMTLDPSPQNLGGLSTLSPNFAALSWNKTSYSTVLHTDSGTMLTLGSIARDISVLPQIPIQYGFTDDSGEPIVIPYSDCSVFATSSGIGELRSSNVRGEKRYATKDYGPRVQSSSGLRTPFVGQGEILSPGDRVRQFSRDGRFVRMIYNKPATAVARLMDSTLMIGNGAKIIVLRPGGVADSVDVTSTVCTDADVAGYVNSISTAGDGSLLAFVNGLRLLDLETLGTKPWRCGGILRSLDTGRTWVPCETPLESPYYLGSIRTASGAIVSSATTVVRDTTPQPTPNFVDPEESLNHTFSDRVVIRSTDNGATWTQVYHSPANKGYRLVGGDGVITKDGTLLLMTIDGVLKSTNDGLEWDFHDPVGMDAGAQIISMFQDTVGSPVYYCTTVGLYKEKPVTDVQDDQQRSRPQIHAARTWYDHVSYWKRSGMEVKRLFTVLGVELPLTDPPPGLYVAECVMDSGVRVEPILIVSE
ncbi:MAG: WD40/YVTN/BNR-like repeat-containing protein [Bacteroidota bacterium]|jgi:hypothetical protein